LYFAQIFLQKFIPVLYDIPFKEKRVVKTTRFSLIRVYFL